MRTRRVRSDQWCGHAGGYLQLALPIIVAVAVALLAVAGWRISSNPWVGALAAVLMFVVGEVCLVPVGVFGAVFDYYGWVSPSLVYGWVVTFALMVLVTTVLRGEGRPWPLVILLCLAAAGAKSTILPAVGVGIACVALSDLVRHRRVGRDVLGLGAITLGASLLLSSCSTASTISVWRWGQWRRSSARPAVPGDTGRTWLW